MARIPEAEISRIKSTVDLAALVRSKGITLSPHGSRDLVGLSPFTEEKEPSFIVSPHKNLWHCMSSGKGGSVIDFVMHYEGLSFRHAFELLADGDLSELLRSEEPTRQCTTRKLKSPLAFDSNDQTLLAQVVDYYQERLKQTPAALEYLQQRGLNHPELIDTFRIGFADRTLGLRLPERNRKAGAEIRERLIELGIYRETGHEHFNGSIVFPIIDEEGRITEMYGRKVGKQLRKGTPFHLYLPGPHVGVFNPAGVRGEEVILTESLIDALTFWVHGLRNVTCIYGTEGFPDELPDLLTSRKVQRVRIAYDHDAAGDRAAERDARRLNALGIEVYRVKFPHGMDPNEYALKVTPAARSLQSAVNSAQWVGTNPHTRASSSILAANVSSSAPVGSAPDASDAAAKRKMQGAVQLETEGDYLQARLGTRAYRVGGIERNAAIDVMKVSLRLGVESPEGVALFYLDTLDLMQDAHRRRFIDRAAKETLLEAEQIKRDLGKLLLALEEYRDQVRRTATAGPAAPVLSPEEREEALSFLRAPDLLNRIDRAFDDCGLVGEETNRLAAYLACTSRKLSKPLAVIVQSTSAAGKTALMEAALSMFPEEERVKYSAMTGQSLYYLGETDLKHKVLAIVEEEGAEKASYALKLLQSEGELTIASTGKDPNTGRMETQEYHVEGPVMIFLTTTAIDIDEELMNRCLVLTVDEGREQTERIHALQRKARTLEGLLARERKQDLLRVLRNAQRLIKPYPIVNDYAEQLTFVSERTRSRRDHEKYLTLIDTVTLLHQYQRAAETRDVQGRPVAFIRTTLDDIAAANRLAPEVLGRSLDELPPQTRRLFGLLKQMVRERCEAEAIEPRRCLFTRRGLREYTRWSATQIKVHLDRLQDLEYVWPRAGRLGAAFEYELLIDPNEAEQRPHIGLLDIERLCRGYDEDLSAFSGTSRGGVGVGSERVKALEVSV